MSPPLGLSCVGVFSSGWLPPGKTGSPWGRGRGAEWRVLLSNELADKRVQLVVILDAHELVDDITAADGDHRGNGGHLGGGSHVNHTLTIILNLSLTDRPTSQ